MNAEQERWIASMVDKLREIGVYTPAELIEARERMVRVANDPTASNRIARRRVQEGSGP